jgi:hypothetical protein
MDGATGLIHNTHPKGKTSVAGTCRKEMETHPYGVRDTAFDPKVFLRLLVQ